MNLPIIGLVVCAAMILIGIGVWIERPRRAVIEPLRPPRPLWAGIRQAAARHPAPALAAIETGFWLLAVVALIGLVRAPREGSFAFFIWAITIVPHEIGHVVCSPFGWFLWVAGGSIWQVLIFVLPALWAFWVRRQAGVSLFFWSLAGYSLVNLGVYIGDARARDLPLILGMSKDHHDWWNLLRELDLLDYDRFLATLATISGVGIVVAAATLGIVTAWVLPRSRFLPGRRFEGGFWRALRDHLRPGR